LPGKALAGRLRRGSAALFGPAYSAVCFFTVLPLARLAAVPPNLANAAPLLPVVGAGIGAAAGAAAQEAVPLLGGPAARAIGLALLAGLAGGLHQDGLADCADALGAGGPSSRRLEVMAEGSIGAFGALALIGWAVGGYAALSALASRHLLAALLLAGSCSRFGAAAHGLAARPAKPGGLGASFAVGPVGLLVATALCLAIDGPTVGLGRTAIALGLTAAGALAVAAWARRAVGGRTGDTLGCAIAAGELLCLFAAAAFWRGG